jgi:hypothetical protein
MTDTFDSESEKIIKIRQLEGVLKNAHSLKKNGVPLKHCPKIKEACNYLSKQFSAGYLSPFQVGHYFSYVCRGHPEVCEQNIEKRG